MSRPLPITKMHHLALAVRDTAVSRDFYCRILGFREVERPPFDFPGAWLVGHGMQIHILEKPEFAPSPEEQPNSRGVHYAFALTDSSELTILLQKHGVHYVQKVNAGKIHQTFFQDPDGHTIEVAVYPADPDFID